MILTVLLIFIDTEKQPYSFLTLMGIYAVSALKLIPGIMRILNMTQALKGLKPSIDMIDKEFESVEIFKEKLMKKIKFSIFKKYKISKC